jgi:hypothetical protein
MLPTRIFIQIKPGENTYLPILIILSLLILTALGIWKSYYYWKTKADQPNSKKYRIKSAKMVKNGRKYWQKNA